MALLPIHCSQVLLRWFVCLVEVLVVLRCKILHCGVSSEHWELFGIQSTQSLAASTVLSPIGSFQNSKGLACLSFPLPSQIWGQLDRDFDIGFC